MKFPNYYFLLTDTKFPCVWDLSVNYIDAVNVTDRYVTSNKIENGKKVVSIVLLDKPKGNRITADITIIKDGNILGSKSGVTFTAGVATFSVENWIKNKLKAGGWVNVRV